MAETVVVAGLCARPLAESARAAGWQAIALDLFGDADTRRASVDWRRIGTPAAGTIDPALLRDALRRAARAPGVLGWIAGSGFEAIPQALDAAIPGLPLWGMSAAAVRQVRDPATFFATLDRLGLSHPEVALAPPPVADGWLVKSAGGSGGWHIRRAGDAAEAEGVYWQRMQPGASMSALFLADGTRARLVALNRQIVRPLGRLPFVYAGAIGPIHDDPLAQRVERALAALVPALELRGLASLDFLAHDGEPWLLEINPRPSGSMVLHPRAWRGGLLRAHVRALEGELPQEPPAHPAGVRGCLTVFAARPCRVGLALAGELAQSPHCHDVPAPGARFAPGHPICTVSTTAADVEAVLPDLDLRAGQVLRHLGCAEELDA